jgi:integrase
MRQKNYSINQTKFLSDDERSALARTLSKYSTRDTLLIELALNTGARATELLMISHLDVNPLDKTVLVKGIKGSNDREIPLKPELFDRLWAYSKGVKGKYLFGIGYRRLNDIWGIYRPCKKTFHALRHTFAIELFKRTKDLRLVQVALGHKSINNTMVYAQYVYSKDELKRIIA